MTTNNDDRALALLELCPTDTNKRWYLATLVTPPHQVKQNNIFFFDFITQMKSSFMTEHPEGMIEGNVADHDAFDLHIARKVLSVLDERKNDVV